MSSTVSRRPSPAVLALALAAAGAAFAAAPAAAQQINPAASEIAFVSKQMGVPVEGKFRKWSAQIAFDPKKPEAGKVSFAIDTGSATFASAETDAEVVKPAWLGVAKFPQATFASTSIKPLGGGRYDVAGVLTIKGRAQPVTVPVTLAPSGTQATASGAFTIKRLAFQVGDGEWADTSMVADEVQVKFKLALTGMPS